MPVAQLSLWDNEASESGYRCLADLELENIGDYNSSYLDFVREHYF